MMETKVPTLDEIADIELKDKVQVLIGGNHLADSSMPCENIRSQRHKSDLTTKVLTPYITARLLQGIELPIVTHGNGPQVGWSEKRSQYGVEQGFEPLALYMGVANTQAGIGLLLSRGFERHFRNNGHKLFVEMVQTSVEVDPYDTAFDHRTKEIGSWTNETELVEEYMKRFGWAYNERQGEDGLEWRRKVPSPKPLYLDPSSSRSIKRASEAGDLVIACGGGGIAFVRYNIKDPNMRDYMVTRGWITEDEAEKLRDGDQVDVDAVIDKDLTSVVLASDTKRQRTIIVTNEDAVYANYGKTNQERYEVLTVDEARKELEENPENFGESSMTPKFLSAIQSAEAGTEVIICALDNFYDALRGNAGTRVLPDSKTRFELEY
jgi:carbamate kinase